MTVKEPKTIRHENVWEGKLVKNKYEKLPNSIVVLFGIFDAFLFLNLVLFPWATQYKQITRILCLHVVQQQGALFVGVYGERVKKSWSGAIIHFWEELYKHNEK